MAQVKAFSLGGLGSPCCCASSGPPFATCSPCNIPETNLTLAWNYTFGIFAGTGSGTLAYSSSNWTMPCTADNSGTKSAKCVYNCLFLGGVMQWVFDWTSTNATCACSFPEVCSEDSWSNTGGGVWSIASHTCSPFMIVWTQTSGGLTNTITIHA